jgi:hypothetical protein
MFVILVSSVNYIYIVRPLNSDIINRLEESTADLAIKSSAIISSYSPSEKIDNIEKIVELFHKVAAYLDPLENIVFESYETIILYSNFILFLSVFNSVLLIFVISISSKS